MSKKATPQPQPKATTQSKSPMNKKETLEAQYAQLLLELGKTVLQAQMIEVKKTKIYADIESLRAAAAALEREVAP